MSCEAPYVVIIEMLYTDKYHLEIIKLMNLKIVAFLKNNETVLNAKKQLKQLNFKKK
jgi:hypothetical protein